VRLINIKENDGIAGIATVPREDDEEGLTEGGEATDASDATTPENP